MKASELVKATGEKACLKTWIDEVKGEQAWENKKAIEGLRSENKRVKKEKGVRFLEKQHVVPQRQRQLCVVHNEVKSRKHFLQTFAEKNGKAIHGAFHLLKKDLTRVEIEADMLHCGVLGNIVFTVKTHCEVVRFPNVCNDLPECIFLHFLVILCKKFKCSLIGQY